MQRIRLLVVAGAIVIAATVGFSHTAGAEGEGNYKDSFTEECAHLLAEGGTLDDARSANLLVPAPHELLRHPGFLIVFGFL